MSMAMASLEYSLPDLLERAGCTLRSRNRADCPQCGGRRTLSFTEELFCCHHVACPSFCTTRRERVYIT